MRLSRYLQLRVYEKQMVAKGNGNDQHTNGSDQHTKQREFMEEDQVFVRIFNSWGRMDPRSNKKKVRIYFNACERVEQTNLSEDMSIMYVNVDLPLRHQHSLNREYQQMAIEEPNHHNEMLAAGFSLIKRDNTPISDSRRPEDLETRYS